MVASAASVVSCIVLGVLILTFLIWVWGSVLDSIEHDPGRVRALMFIILSTVAACELSLVTCGIFHSIVVWISLVANLWGGLDALLRYPASHDLDSFFSAKQIGLLLIKTAAYSFGAVDFRASTGIICIALLLAVWSLPILFLMAMPMDPKEQVAKNDKYDIDLLVRVWQLVASSRERNHCLSVCRFWWNRKLMAASESSSLARMAICYASPQYHRAFKRVGRSV